MEDSKKTPLIMSNVEKKRYQAIGAALFYEGAELTDYLSQEYEMHNKMTRKIVDAFEYVKDLGKRFINFVWRSYFAKVVKRAFVAIGLGILLFTDWFKELAKHAARWFTVSLSDTMMKVYDAIIGYDYTSIGVKIEEAWWNVRAWLSYLPKNSQAV